MRRIDRETDRSTDRPAARQTPRPAARQTSRPARGSIPFRAARGAWLIPAAFLLALALLVAAPGPAASGPAPNPDPAAAPTPAPQDRPADQAEQVDQTRQTGQTGQTGPAAELRLRSYATALPPDRLGAVAGAIGFDAWPRPEGLFVAPAVTRALLPEPEALGRSVRACTAVRFDGEPWGHCEWSWPLREGARRGQSRQEPARLHLAMTLAPGARAAQEVLLTLLTDTMLPTEGVVATLQGAARPEGLGDVAFLLESRDGSAVRLHFTRANLAFELRGDGALAPAVLTLARRLDARVLDQQPLSREQLLSRRPTVDLAARPDARGLPYTIRVPDGRPVVAVQARVGDRAAPASGGRVLLEAGGMAGPEADRMEGRMEAAPVELVVVTAELLAAEGRRGETP